jgi:hypothetical protein
MTTYVSSFPDVSSGDGVREDAECRVERRSPSAVPEVIPLLWELVLKSRLLPCELYAQSRLWLGSRSPN